MAGSSLSRSSSLLISFLHVIVVMHHLADFKDGDRRKQPDKQEHEQQEESKGSYEGCPVPAGRYVSAPGGRQEVARQAHDHNHKALEPHAAVDYQGKNKYHRYTHADLLRPQQL